MIVAPLVYFVAMGTLVFYKNVLFIHVCIKAIDVSQKLKSQLSMYMYIGLHGILLREHLMILL